MCLDCALVVSTPGTPDPPKHRSRRQSTGQYRNTQRVQKEEALCVRARTSSPRKSPRSLPVSPELDDMSPRAALEARRAESGGERGRARRHYRELETQWKNEKKQDLLAPQATEEHPTGGTGECVRRSGRRGGRTQR